MWAGSLIPINAAIVIVADTGAQVDESIVRLARVGIENVKGYLAVACRVGARQDFR